MTHSPPSLTFPSSLISSLPFLFQQTRLNPTNFFNPSQNLSSVSTNLINFRSTLSSHKNKKSTAACFTATEANPVGSTRLEVLVTEFEALTEPIERVRRLLDYAARLPLFDESARTPENRVTGCATQVWMEARVDEAGRMRFRGDSDSEITKGFISCLIWLLDGAEPEAVVAVKAEELAVVNVGIFGKEQSRVNTWHNVLISMQSRTQALLRARWEKLDASFLRSLDMEL